MPILPLWTSKLSSSIPTHPTIDCRVSTHSPLSPPLLFRWTTMSLPRWKGKGFADIAHATPMSVIVKKLKTSLIQSEATAILSGCDVILEVGLELAVLLNRACFGQPLSTSEKDRQWFQLGPEEAVYLSHNLKCLAIVSKDETPKKDEELWEYMTTQMNEFPLLYKAYSHLRTKNWVVRPGSQYGVDYVAYRHHPALVHSEYAILVLPEGDVDHLRLQSWSDWQCILRVTGGVAKSVLVLSIKRDKSTASSLSCLEQYTVEEHVIRRWVPEQSREVNSSCESGTQSEQNTSHENETQFKQKAVVHGSKSPE